MVKRLDTAVYNAIKDATMGQFKSGEFYFGLKDGSIDWALDEHNKSIFTQADLSKIDIIKKNITSGKVKVRDYYSNR